MKFTQKIIDKIFSEQNFLEHHDEYLKNQELFNVEVLNEMIEAQPKFPFSLDVSENEEYDKIEKSIENLKNDHTIEEHYPRKSSEYYFFQNNKGLKNE